VAIWRTGVELTAFNWTVLPVRIWCRQTSVWPVSGDWCSAIKWNRTIFVRLRRLWL